MNWEKKDSFTAASKKETYPKYQARKDEFEKKKKEDADKEKDPVKKKQILDKRLKTFCARSVREILAAGGLVIENRPDAWQYDEVLQKHPNFKEVSGIDLKDPKFEFGDVAVFQKDPRNTSGHMQIYTPGCEFEEKGVTTERPCWVSFMQQTGMSGFYPNNGYRGGSFRVFRYKPDEPVQAGSKAGSTAVQDEGKEVYGPPAPTQEVTNALP